MAFVFFTSALVLKIHYTALWWRGCGFVVEGGGKDKVKCIFCSIESGVESSHKPLQAIRHNKLTSSSSWKLLLCVSC